MVTPPSYPVTQSRRLVAISKRRLLDAKERIERGATWGAVSADLGISENCLRGRLKALGEIPEKRKSPDSLSAYEAAAWRMQNEGKSRCEIAHALNTSRDCVKLFLFRARRKLGVPAMPPQPKLLTRGEERVWKYYNLDGDKDTVASRLNITPKHVGVCLSNARRKLRQAGLLA